MMEFSIGSGGSDQQEASNSRKGKKSYHRHTSHQIQRLEAFFKECPHPDENQRRQLSRELGLETKQIKFWFQNKRTQTKAQNERSDNTVLRSENERIHCENLAIKEALKNVICPSCGGPPFGEEERQLSLQKLQLENAQLKEEHEKVSNLLAKYIGKPIESLATVQAIPMELLSPGNNSMNQGIGSSTTPGLDLDLSSGGAHSFGNFNCNSSNIPTYHFRAIPDLEKALMAETATGAMAELVRLLQFDDPLWIKSPATDGRYSLHRDTYDNIFPRANHFKTTSAHFESSKDSAVVILNAMHLIDIFMDSNKWSDLFPSIITKAKTVQVLEDGMLGSRNGALQLMYEQMHMLSPLVPQREFYILRNCQQIDQGMWVIADVSYDFSNVDPNISLSRAWKLPSGCLIQEMPNGCSKVTWVEHVEVDDKTQTHRLYRDLICNAIAYGAERWVVTLQRMSERMAYSLSESAPPCEFGVITSLQGRRSVMQLSHRMVKNFCEMLSMAGKLDFPQLSEVNNSGVRVSVRNSTQVGQPCGLIVSAATSLWLPLPPQTVFNFFRNEKNRLEWDILSNSNQVNEIAHISVGAHPGNCISIIRPFIPTESNIVMLQETSIDSLGSMLIYAPIDIPALTVAIKGENPSTIPVLPSGFIVSSDGRSDHHSTTSATPGSSASSSSNNMIIAGKSSSSSGSLLTVAFQILVSSPNASKQLNMESVATVNTLISSTVQRIKAALNCSNLD